MNTITTITPQITIEGDNLSTTSSAVAEFFGRTHKSVLRAIENLKCSAEFTSAHLCAHVKTVAMPKGATRKDTYYIMTEQGFTILVMGFTGERAMKFKEAYITQFHAMQTEILNGYKQAALPSTITPKQKLAIRDAMNKKVYDNYGKKQIPTGFKTEWHDFYEAFEISAYAELPTERFDDAMGYILGEWMPETQQAAIGDDKIVVNKANYEAQQQLTKMLCERISGLEEMVKEVDYLEASIHLTLSIAEKSLRMGKELEYLTHDVVRDLKAMRPKVALA